MGYRITLHRKAAKFIDHLPRKERQHVWSHINQLRDDPRPAGKCRKLTDFKPEGWRIRVGDYRVLYQVLDDELLVWVFQIDLRAEDTYRN